MATTIEKNCCAICNKEKAKSKCEGCSKDFCSSHFADHRQELSKQIDEVEVSCDLFRQMLTQQSSPSSQHSVMQRIDKWERDSIQKVRQTAEEARQLLLKNFDLIIAQLYVPNISANTKWIQKGITAAGGNGRGVGLNQLNYPRNVYIDSDQTMYIADYSNHRIMEWKYGATSGQVVAGGNRLGNRTHQLNNPSDVIVDEEQDCLIISDYGNRRVMRWPRRNGTNGQILISDIDCSGLMMDNHGFLYVSDSQKHEVRRWRMGDESGTVVAGGNGRGSRLDQLSFPTSIFVDRDHSVYVSDSENHRVMKWMKGAKEGIVVAGGPDQKKGSIQLSSPRGVFSDSLGTVYVVDWSNARVLSWPKGATQGTIIVGGNGEGAEAHQFYCPMEETTIPKHEQHTLDTAYKTEIRNDKTRLNTENQSKTRSNISNDSNQPTTSKTSSRVINNDEYNKNNVNQQRSDTNNRSIISLTNYRITFDDSDDDDASSYISWARRDILEYRNNYPSVRSDSKITQNYRFYTNQLESYPDGDLIDNIHKLWFRDYDRLEFHHGYTQWLFPLQERGLNCYTEPLQKHEIESIKKDEKALKRILTSYELMLDFYGFKLIDKKTGEIDRLSGDSYKSRFHNLNTSSHNYLRITRILKCLGEFDYEYLKFPFLEQILREIIIENTLPNCLQSCKDYWIETLRSRNERHAIRQYARQLVEYRNQGLTSSKSLRAIRPSITKETAAKS
ncbi:unnamed protein product [Rotaria sp. Silwood1]|nr:unnamed protein product [Rotaria sp. Silwood1]